MDNQFYQQPYQQPYQQMQPPMPDRRSRGMELAALVFAIVGIISYCLVYTTLIGGSLAIVFALLSRGGEAKLTRGAKVALVLGCLAIALIIGIIAYTLYTAYAVYGGLDNMMRAIYEGMGINYDALFD